MHFPYNNTQNHNGVLIFMGRDGNKQKHVPQLHQTNKKDWNLGFVNAPSLPECFELCVMETGLGGSV